MVASVTGETDEILLLEWLNIVPSDNGVEQDPLAEVEVPAMRPVAESQPTPVDERRALLDALSTLREIVREGMPHPRCRSVGTRQRFAALEPTAVSGAGRRLQFHQRSPMRAGARTHPDYTHGPSPNRRSRDADSVA